MNFSLDEIIKFSVSVIQEKEYQMWIYNNYSNVTFGEFDGKHSFLKKIISRMSFFNTEKQEMC